MKVFFLGGSKTLKFKDSNMTFESLNWNTMSHLLSLTRATRPYYLQLLLVLVEEEQKQKWVVVVVVVLLLKEDLGRRC